MKYFLCSLTLVATFTFVWCAPQGELTHSEKQEKARQECNITHPVSEDARTKIIASVISGEKIPNPKNLSELWCNLECQLQKINFLDENANLRAPGVFKYAVKSIPQLASNSHVFLVQMFQLYRSTKEMKNDQCFKSYILFRQFVDAIFTDTLADEMNKDLNIREEILKSVNSGKDFPESVTKKVKSYLQTIDKMMKFYAAEAQDLLPVTIDESSSPANRVLV